MKQFFIKILNAVKTMSSRSYWTRVNTVEAWGFATKIANEKQMGPSQHQMSAVTLAKFDHETVDHAQSLREIYNE